MAWIYLAESEESVTLCESTLTQLPIVKKKAIVKYAKELDKRYKRINKQTYEEPEPIDANDETDMKYFLKIHIFCTNVDIGSLCSLNCRNDINCRYTKYYIYVIIRY